jgi:hypothetical protein
MVYVKEILTGVVALGCAIGIGFVMQNSEAGSAHYGADGFQESVQPIAINGIKGANAANAMLEVQQIELTSGELENVISLPETEAQVVKASAPAVLDVPEVPEIDLAPVDPIPSCEVTASARPIAAAMVELTLAATCLPNERATVHHSGLVFTETTSASGTMNIKIPALARDAVFIVAFTNGEGAVAQTVIEDLSDYRRAVLQWKGNTGFQIHAREFGAGYGDEGHLWEGQPGTVADAVTGAGGVLTRHGDTSVADPLLAEVYTFPANTATRAGDIALSVETEVTAANCGIEIEAQSLELQTDGSMNTRNLTLPVPDCDATGSFLVLNNLLQDMKVASR